MFRFSFTATLILASGCGYSFGSRIPEDIKTVRVDAAGRWPLAARGLEFDLTGAVATEVNRRYGVSVVRDAPPAYADAALEMEITAYSTSAAGSLLSKIEDATLSVEVAVKVKRRKPDGSEENLFDGKITQREPYSPSRGETESGARARAVKSLAGKIADCLSAW